MRGSPAGKVIIDVGLLDCNSVAIAVERGFLVHGFEPLPSHMKNCRNLLAKESYFEVPVVNGKVAYHTRPAAPIGRGFAYLYPAALGSVASEATFVVAGGKLDHRGK